nr:hypothetical protein Iba_chr08aCG8110 [Ipomoea batatas]GME01822.1 hypothetical protein Iba_scaffold1679452CG0010 [Ipomoea batatas]
MEICNIMLRLHFMGSQIMRSNKGWGCSKTSRWRVYCATNQRLCGKDVEKIRGENSWASLRPSVVFDAC